MVQSGRHGWTRAPQSSPGRPWARNAALVAAATLASAGARILPAQGGPPLRTDDTGTPGDGRWEVNLAAAMEERGGERVLEAPLLDVNYGAGERIQLKFELPWIFLHHRDEERNGLGRSQIGVKCRFLEQQANWLDASVYPQVEFNNPTSSAKRGLVEEGSEWLLPIQLEKNFGRLSLNPEFGYAVLEDEDEWLYGLALGGPLFEGLDLLSEVHGTARFDFEDDELLVQAGCRWAATRNLTLLAAVGQGIRSFEDDELVLAVYLGVQFLFGAAPPEGRAPDISGHRGMIQETDHEMLHR